MPVILATQKAEIRMIMSRSQPGQIVYETLSRKNPSQKMVGGMTQVVSPEFNLQHCEKNVPFLPVDHYFNKLK
jgi:hypothetical protein